MRDNLARQQAAYLKAHGAPMTAAQNAHALSTMLALQSLYFEDSETAARPELSSESFYKSIVPNSSIDPQLLAQCLALSAARCGREDSLAAPSPSAYLKSVSECGFAIGSMPTQRVSDICDELYAIQAQLAAAGLPPQFVFVFNAAWQLLDHMWAGAASDVLGDNSVMEVSRMISFFPQFVSQHDPG